MREADYSNRKLTQKQVRCLELCAEGITGKEMGEKLFCSESNICRLKSEIFYKLGAYNQIQAVTIGFRRGLLK